MKAKKLVISGLVLVGLTSVLIGCGKKEKPKNGEVEIEFFSQKKEMQAPLDTIIKDFEKENPKIKVKFTNVPDAGTVLKTRIASNDIPDVINVFPQNADFQEWAKADIFEDLTGKDYLNRLKAGAAEAYAINDKIYSVPLTSNAWGFYYNDTKFKEFGLTPPKDWTEFEKLVSTIKEKGKDPFALSLTQADAWTLNGYHQLAWATVTGGFKAANDALVRSPKDGIKTNKAAFKKVTHELDLLHGNGQKNANGATYDDAIAAFSKENALILPNGTWALPAIKNQKPKFDIKMFAYPGQNEGDDLTVGAADLALSISKTSEQKEAAEKFVDYMTTKQAMQKYYDVDGSPTSVIDVDTKGKFPETEGVTQYVFTEHQIIWLQKDWKSEEDFHSLTVEYVNDPNPKELANNLNAFFNVMKK
ncbi:extracellular solute-binding protein [Vagococcus vulneris]|uniref:Sugar ABC transporter substrate-binding protein n=1 Tax=Vagococcus vulneris TaxID=1977869 RepID=A0A429ZYP2_9ENTE|nr:extracellular solute-binding protein [Vagococcus vulneris]RST99090.1 sugar ABC transporter substrate-binding protein [Vagococcus vulneris]